VGPGFFDYDLSIMKNFKIPHWEAGKLGVGFQFFNLFNHPNFDKPINDIAQGAGLFGTITNLVSVPTSILRSFVGRQRLATHHPVTGAVRLLIGGRLRAEQE
jgi:hypothetical protein